MRRKRGRRVHFGGMQHAEHGLRRTLHHEQRLRAWRLLSLGGVRTKERHRRGVHVRRRVQFRFLHRRCVLQCGVQRPVRELWSDGVRWKLCPRFGNAPGRPAELHGGDRHGSVFGCDMQRQGPRDLRRVRVRHPVPRRRLSGWGRSIGGDLRRKRRVSGREDEGLQRVRLRRDGLQGCVHQQCGLRVAELLQRRVRSVRIGRELRRLEAVRVRRNLRGRLCAVRLRWRQLRATVPEQYALLGGLRV